MAHVVADRVRETTTTTGTGTYTLAGAVTGFETFGSIGNSNTTYYCCTDGTDFEVGVGTYTSSGTTLARTTILQSSNSDSAVNWSSGTRQIFCTAPAEKSVILDPNNDTTIKSSDGAILKLQTSDTTVADGDVIGAIEFSAPNEASGTDAITTAASILAEADATFSSSANNTDLLFKLGTSGVATEKMRLTHEGNLALKGAANGAYLRLNRDDTTVNDGDVIGGITFTAHNEASGTDAITTAASIVTEADATFSSSNNETDLVFKLGESGAATEKMRLQHEGNLTLTSDDGTGSNVRPNLVLDRVSASPADNDFLGQVNFKGRNDADETVTFGTIRVRSTDVSDSSEDSQMQIRTVKNGSGENSVIIENDTTTFNGGIVIADAGNIGSASDTDAISIASNGQVTFTQTLIGTDLDISGDVDVDGTLEADAITLDGTAITTTATLSTGISNNNVPKFTSGVADNDFLRVDGTAIEGRSASEVLSDIGGTTATDAANEATALAIALG